MIEQTHQKLKTNFKIKISPDQPQWDQYVSIAVIAQNINYHASLKCAQTEFFHGRTPHSAIDLKFAIPIHVTNQSTDTSMMLDEVNKNTSKTCTTSSHHSIKTRHFKITYPVPSHSKLTSLCFFWTHSMTTTAGNNISNRFTDKGPTKWWECYPTVTTSLDR